MLCWTFFRVPFMQWMETEVSVLPSAMPFFLVQYTRQNKYNYEICRFYISAPVTVFGFMLGDKDGHFSINSETGFYHGFACCVQAYQDDDPRKYSVATALVRVLAVNRFHPEFELPQYCGFVTAGKSAVSLVNTYGSRALILNVQDQDFDNVNHGTAMQHMEEVSFQNEEYGIYNPSFSFPDKAGITTMEDIPISKVPSSPTTAAGIETTTPFPNETVQSPAILNNNVSTPTKISCSSPDCHPAKQVLSPAHMVDADMLSKENAGLPCDVTPDPTEEQSNTVLDPATKDDIMSSPLNEQKLKTTPSNNLAESAPSPSSPSSSELTSAEMDNPLLKTTKQTPSHSPSLSPSLPRETGTPKPTPEYGRLKATLVHLDTSPTDTPPESPVGTGLTLNAEVYQPSTSLDHVEPSESEEGVVDVESPSPDRRPLTTSGNTLNSRKEEDEEGFLGDDDVDKNSEGEKLLTVTASCTRNYIPSQ
ncbi:hypothetical protein GOODEAATRI_005920, partial [Goodea atripinnis]